VPTIFRPAISKPSFKTGTGVGDEGVRTGNQRQIPAIERTVSIFADRKRMEGPRERIA